MGIKLITLVTQEGSSNSKKGILQGTQEIRSECDRDFFYKNPIDDLLNNVILGNDINEYQHDLPLEDNANDTRRGIDMLMFENTKICKIMDDFDKIL